VRAWPLADMLGAGKGEVNQNEGVYATRAKRYTPAGGGPRGTMAGGERRREELQMLARAKGRRAKEKCTKAADGGLVHSMLPAVSVKNRQRRNTHWKLVLATLSLDNSGSGCSVVLLSRTPSFFALEKSPTEPALGSETQESSIKLKPSVARTTAGLMTETFEYKYAYVCTSGTTNSDEEMHHDKDTITETHGHPQHELTTRGD